MAVSVRCHLLVGREISVPARAWDDGTLSRRPPTRAHEEATSHTQPRVPTTRALKSLMEHQLMEHPRWHIDGTSDGTAADAWHLTHAHVSKLVGPQKHALWKQEEKQRDPGGER